MKRQYSHIVEEAVLELSKSAREYGNLWFDTEHRLAPREVRRGVVAAVLPIAKLADTIHIYPRKDGNRTPPTASLRRQLSEYGVDRSGEVEMTPALLNDVPFWTQLVLQGVTALVEVDLDRFDPAAFLATVWNPTVRGRTIHTVAPAALRRAKTRARSSSRVAFVTSATAMGPQLGVVAAPAVLEKLMRMAKTAVQTSPRYRLTYCTVNVGAFRDEASWDFLFSLDDVNDPLAHIRRTMRRAIEHPEIESAARAGYGAAELIAVLSGVGAKDLPDDVNSWTRTHRGLRRDVTPDDVSTAIRAMRLIKRRSPSRDDWLTAEMKTLWLEACQDLVDRLSTVRRRQKHQRVRSRLG